MDLQIIKHSVGLMVDSRDVAEMLGKRHGDLLETISGYVKFLLNGEFRLTDFFLFTTYSDSINRTLPRYLLTRKGCDMVANKMTGEKGVLFTAAYVTKFEEMEKELAQPRLPVSYLEALEALVASEREKQTLLPKAEYFDALVERNLLTNFRDTAKELKVKEGLFIDWLIDKKYVYRDLSSKLKPFAQHVPKLFEIKEWSNDKKAGNQTMITPRGRETFRLLLKERGADNVGNDTQAAIGESNYQRARLGL